MALLACFDLGRDAFSDGKIFVKIWVYCYEFSQLRRMSHMIRRNSYVLLTCLVARRVEAIEVNWNRKLFFALCMPFFKSGSLLTLPTRPVEHTAQEYDDHGSLNIWAQDYDERASPLLDKCLIGQHP